MRPPLIAPALLLSACLAACGTDQADAGPERRSATGQVLVGEVSDAMLPLDTVRSTAPAAASTSAEGSDGEATAPSPTTEESGAALPSPEVSGDPEPLPSDPGAEDAPSAPQP